MKLHANAALSLHQRRRMARWVLEQGGTRVQGLDPVDHAGAGELQRHRGPPAKTITRSGRSPLAVTTAFAAPQGA